MKSKRPPSRDRLDGTRNFNPISAFYLVPGRVWLWLNYMNPKGGYAGVRMATRHARSPIMTWIYSGMFWIAVLPIFASLFIPALGMVLFGVGILVTGAAVATINVFTFTTSVILFGLYYLKNSGVI